MKCFKFETFKIRVGKSPYKTKWPEIRDYKTTKVLRSMKRNHSFAMLAIMAYLLIDFSKSIDRDSLV